MRQRPAELCFDRQQERVVADFAAQVDDVVNRQLLRRNFLHSLFVGNDPVMRQTADLITAASVRATQEAIGTLKPFAGFNEVDLNVGLLRKEEVPPPQGGTISAMGTQARDLGATAEVKLGISPLYLETITKQVYYGLKTGDKSLVYGNLYKFQASCFHEFKHNEQVLQEGADSAPAYVDFTGWFRDKRELSAEQAALRYLQDKQVSQYPAAQAAKDHVVHLQEQQVARLRRGVRMGRR